MKNNLVRLNETKELKNLTVLVTSRCTMRCKHCATYASRHPLPSDYSIDLLKKSFERYMRCVSAYSKIGLITISGGEPLLHPELPEFINFISEYEEKVRMIEIITNATIVPSEALVSSLSKCDKINLLIDNYGDKLSRNLEKMTRILNENDIAFRIRNYTNVDTYCDGWIDVSDFTFKNRTEDQIKKVFKECAFNNIYKNIDFLINGRIHMCYAIKEALEEVEELEEESVDLMNDSLSDEEITEQIQNLRNRKYLMACKNCNGYLIENGVRRVPAEQMK